MTSDLQDPDVPSSDFTRGSVIVCLPTYLAACPSMSCQGQMERLIVSTSAYTLSLNKETLLSKRSYTILLCDSNHTRTCPTWWWLFNVLPQKGSAMFRASNQASEIPIGMNCHAGLCLRRAWHSNERDGRRGYDRATEQCGCVYTRCRSLQGAYCDREVTEPCHSLELLCLLPADRHIPGSATPTAAQVAK